jgi:hypothetical protein
MSNPIRIGIFAGSSIVPAVELDAGLEHLK